jgi:MFS family permease
LLRGPLSSRNFRLLSACSVISVGGSQIATVAMPFAVLRSGGSASDVGYVAAAELIAMIGTLLLGGTISDRAPRHQVMMAAEALQAAAQGIAAVLLLTGQAHVWQLAAVAAAGGAGFGFYYPAAQGLLPQTVQASQLAQANALFRTGRNAASIGGAALGGILTGLAGPGWALAADAATFAAAAALRAGMRFQRLPPGQTTNAFRDLRDGWRQFSSRRWLWAVVAQFTVVTGIYAAAMQVLGPLTAHADLGGARSWGLITAAYAVGAVAGGLVMTRYRPERLLVAGMLSVPAYSLLLFALAVPLSVPLDLGAALAAGGSLEVFTVCWATTLQQEIPPDKLSRVVSYDALGGVALTPVATAVAGPAAAAFGTTAVLTVAGALVATLPVLVLLTPEVRHIRRDDPIPLKDGRGLEPAAPTRVDGRGAHPTVVFAVTGRLARNSRCGHHRRLVPSSLTHTAQPEQAECGKDERDEAVADAIGGPHRGVREAGRVEHAPSADRQHAGQFHRAGQDGDPASCPAAVDEGDRGDDVHHAGEGRQHVRDGGPAELRRDLRPGPCASGECEQTVDGDQQPTGARLGRLRRRRHSLRRCLGLRHE